MSLTIKNVPTSTQSKPLVSINGDLYDPNKLAEVIQRAKGMPSAAKYEEDVPLAAPDAPLADAPAARPAAAVSTPS